MQVNHIEQSLAHNKDYLCYLFTDEETEAERVKWNSSL